MFLEQQISIFRTISEGSCDTELMLKIQVYHHRNKFDFKIHDITVFTVYLIN